MDKLMDHIRPYDFFGIWGSGIITVIYGILTGSVIAGIDLFSVFREYQADYSLLIIFILCVTAYFVGTVLHEAGKVFCDFFLSAPDKLIKRDKPEKRGRWNIVRIIRYDFYVNASAGIVEYMRKVESNDGKFPTLAFDLMITELKNSSACKFIDRYHAIYGLARGMMMGMLFHLTVMTALIPFVANLSLFVVMGIDVFLFALLLLRTYRNYCGWIKAVLNQYVLLTNGQRP